MFSEFINDPKAWDMYITGPAGTGKTTSLRTELEYCIDNNIKAIVCAFTHKACNILSSKLPKKAQIQTLHSFLKKRPAINEHAIKHQHIDTTITKGKSERPQVLFIDEFSMVGEKDLMDIRALQDPEYEGQAAMKVVWIGDLNQLPPVGDAQTVNPRGPYWQKLTKIHRQAEDNPLLDPLSQLVSFIEGAEPEALIESDSFIRRQDIVEWYINDKNRGLTDQVLLAYTNQRVQSLNQEIAGKSSPEVEDYLFSPTTQHHYTFVSAVDPNDVSYIARSYDDLLGFNSKYKTLEYLVDSELCEFMEIQEDGEDEPLVWAVVFGHYNYRQQVSLLKKAAADSNARIEEEFGQSAAGWAKRNPTHKLARARSKAWRDFLTFNECVICLDFPYAMTVHKSQGSTFEYVYLDTEDLGKCASFDYKTYLKLMYVAISRASKVVVTN